MAKSAKTKKQEATKEIGLTVINGGQPREKKIKVKDNSGAANTKQIGEQRGQAYQAAKIEIARCAHNIGASFFHLGKALKDVRDRDLWKEGEAKSWTEFAKTIGGVTYATVCNLISVVENLDVATAARLGPTIAYAVARAPGEDCKSELIKLASQGATVKEVNRKATEQRKAAGTDRPRKAKPSGKKTTPKDIRKDLESKAPVEKHDAKVETVGQGECKLVKGKGTFTVDGITVEVKLTGKTKLEYVARLS